MRIHTNTEVNIPMLYRFAEVAGATIESVMQHGSRSHDHAFDVHLSGLSRRSAMHKDYSAATWDQWGIFIAQIFDMDDEAKIGIYKNCADFNWRTNARFDGQDAWDSLPRDHDHRFKFSGIPYRQECNKDGCDAAMVWSA